jgi:hypothetical protein
MKGYLPAGAPRSAIWIHRRDVAGWQDKHRFIRDLVDETTRDANQK